MHSSMKQASVTMMLGALVALGAAACGDDSSGPGGAGGAGATTATSGTTADASTGDTTTTTGETASSSSGGDCETAQTDACGVCMADACCTALVDCESDELCWACVTGEDGEACEDNETTHARVDVYLTCRGGDCNEACIGSAGDCEEAAPEFGADCGACLVASCCEQLGACYGSEGCWGSCVVDFSEAGCHADADGHALFHALNQCAGTSCEEECL